MELVQNIKAKPKKQPNPKAKRFRAILFVVIGVGMFSIAGYFYFRSRGIGLNDIKNFLEDKFSRKEVKPEEVWFCFDKKLSPSLKDELEDWTDDLDLNEDSDDKKDEPHLIVKTDEFSPEDGPAKKCDYVVSTQEKENYDLAWRKYHVMVAPVSASIADVTSDQFDQLVAGNSVKIDSANYKLAVDVYSKNYLERIGGIGVTVQVSEDVIGDVYKSSSLLGIVPFENLSYKVKYVTVDGVNILEGIEDEDETSDDSEEGDEKSAASIPLVDEVWVKDKASLGLFSKVRSSLGDVNFDQTKISTVIMTGTSVMGARGLYFKINETGDNLYPIRQVANLLGGADIAHVSNEASFVEGCTQYKGTLVFCGTKESFEDFKTAGIDVVGLTGNHIMDYGKENFLKTLDMYEQAGIKYFGGGKNFADAHEPAILEVSGTSFAFLGYNAIPPASYYVTQTTPGSAELNKTQMIKDIKAAKSEFGADYVLVDMQWGAEYTHEPVAYQIEYGHAAIDAGADIVTGVHPHWVQKMEFYKDGVIFYGLGNFLFDQMWSQKTREGVMVKHYFYEGRYLGFELIPTMIFEGAQPCVVTGADSKRITGYMFGD